MCKMCSANDDRILRKTWLSDILRNDCVQCKKILSKDILFFTLQALTIIEY